MADLPKLNRDKILSLSNPGMRTASVGPADANAGAGMYSLGQMMRGMATRVEDRLDIAAETDARREGAIAGQGEQLPQLRDETTIRGRAFNAAAKDTAVTKLQLDGRLALSQYEEQHLNNPEKFKNLADGYLNGVLPKLQNFDPAFAQEYEADFRLRADGMIGAIKGRQREIVRDQQTETALRMQIAANNEMANQAGAIFDGDPADVEKKIGGMMSNAGRIVDAVNQIGPDGRPLFSARERISAEQAAEDSVSMSIGKAWLDRQPDKLAAYDAWQRGEATIDIGVDNGDGTATTQKISLKELLGESGYQKAESSFFDSLREDLDMQDKVNRVRDREFKNRSDEQAVYFEELAMNGILTERMVDDARPMFDGETYIRMKTLARGGGASVSSGPVLARLAVDDANGVDIRPQLEREYKAGNLTTDHYIEYNSRNTARVTDGVKSPIMVARDDLVNGLGAMNKSLGDIGSEAIANAETEFQFQISEFQNANGRTPSLQEAKDISRDIRRRYAYSETENSLQNIPVPRGMTRTEMAKATSVDVDEKGKFIARHYLEKHGGDKAKAKLDPMYLQEMKELKQLKAIAVEREKADAAAATARSNR